MIQFGECVGVYVDVSKYNDWLDEMMAQQDLPPYEYAVEPTEVPPTNSPSTDPIDVSIETGKPTEPGNSTEVLLTTQSSLSPTPIENYSPSTEGNTGKGSTANTILSSSMLCLICILMSIHF